MELTSQLTIKAGTNTKLVEVITTPLSELLRQNDIFHSFEKTLNRGCSFIVVAGELNMLRPTKIKTVNSQNGHLPGKLYFY